MSRPIQPRALGPAKRRGAIALIAVMIMAAFALAAIASMSTIMVNDLQSTGSQGQTEQVIQAAEGGIQHALYDLATNTQPRTFVQTIGTATVTITVAPSPANPFQRIVTSRATDASGKTRTLRIIATTTSFAGGLTYALLAGNGGIIFDNTSIISGDVYSNGPIGPDGGGDAGIIRPCQNSTQHPTCSTDFPGNVTVSGFNSIRRVNITNGSAAAYTLDTMNGTHGSIARGASYQTLDGTVRANNGSETCSTLVDGIYCHRNSGQQPIKPMIITDDAAEPTSPVPKWVAEINDPTNPNTPLGPNCQIHNPPWDPHHDVPAYCPDGTILSRQKIDTALYVPNGSTLTLSGNVYVTGGIYIDTNATVQIQQDPSIPSSWVLISEGVINVENGSTLRGSGNAISFLTILSRSVATDAGGNEPAIYASNNSRSILFAAPKGMVKVKNSGRLHGTVAEVIKVANHSEVTFDPDLMSLFVPAAVPSAITTSPGSWIEQ